jgi:hypothetical protein
MFTADLDLSSPRISDRDPRLRNAARCSPCSAMISAIATRMQFVESASGSLACRASASRS